MLKKQQTEGLVQIMDCAFCLIFNCKSDEQIISSQLPLKPEFLHTWSQKASKHFQFANRHLNLTANSLIHTHRSNMAMENGEYIKCLNSEGLNMKFYGKED